MDLLVGDRNGVVWQYINSGTSEAPQLETGTRLLNHGLVLDVGSNSCLDVVDWDNDGDLDLLICNEQGLVYIYENTGSSQAAVFGVAPESVVNDYNRLFRAQPVMADLDNDGKKDMILSNYEGKFYFYRNNGTDDAPVFAQVQQVKTPSEAVLSISGAGTHMELVDWNGDGLLDILAGDFNGQIWVCYQHNASAIAEAAGPGSFGLIGNYPNPFNPCTTLSFDLDRGGVVSISIYDVNGRAVRSLLSEFAGAGQHSLQWDGVTDSGVPAGSGVYIAVLRQGSRMSSRRMLMIK